MKIEKRESMAEAQEGAIFCGTQPVIAENMSWENGFEIRIACFPGLRSEAWEVGEIRDQPFTTCS
jgi:hypothetical protein